MNPIAAHKDELKKMLENSSGASAVAGITFTVPGRYITHLDPNCSEIRDRVNPIRRDREQMEN